MDAGEFLPVVHQNMKKATVNGAPNVVVVGDELCGVRQKRRVVDPRSLPQPLPVRLEEADEVCPGGFELDQPIELVRLEESLFGPDTEVDDLVDEPPVAQQVPVGLGPVGLGLRRERLSDIPPLLRAGEEHRGFRVLKPVVMPGDEMVGETVPRIDRDFDKGVEALVEQQPPSKPILQGDFLGPVGNQEQDPVR